MGNRVRKLSLEGLGSGNFNEKAGEFVPQRPVPSLLLGTSSALIMWVFYPAATEPTWPSRVPSFPVLLCFSQIPLCGESHPGTVLSWARALFAFRGKFCLHGPLPLGFRQGIRVLPLLPQGPSLASWCHSPTESSSRWLVILTHSAA